MRSWSYVTMYRGGKIVFDHPFQHLLDKTFHVPQDECNCSMQKGVCDTHRVAYETEKK